MTTKPTPPRGQKITPNTSPGFLVHLIGDFLRQLFAAGARPKKARFAGDLVWCRPAAISLAIFFAAVALAAPRQTQSVTATAPHHRGAPRRLECNLDALMQQAVAADQVPGAVALVWHQGKIVYFKAFGWRSLLPRRERMTPGTIFDLASLTKVLATAPSVMKLAEQGKLRLNDPVAQYLPEFASHGKDQVTIRMLLTHTSGLRPDPELGPGIRDSDDVLKEIDNDTLLAPPGMRFLYSDTGFIVLGEVVERVSGLPLDKFATREIFAPLAMRMTRFLPPHDWIPRIAPTEEVDLPAGARAGSGLGRVLRGEVHDPTARVMGGVAGHAGLFSTARDLAIFCRMMLGEPPSVRRAPLTPATRHQMTSPQSPPWIPELRGLGWDIDSAYSSPRGELFGAGSFGHSGFTGTSMWLDPASRTFVILLANSVHPYRRNAIISLRARLSTAVAAALGAGDTRGAASDIARSTGAARQTDLSGIFERTGHTETGLDVLEAQQFAPLRGKRIGLITNQTGIDSAGRRTIDILAHAEGVRLSAIFNPEHGIFGKIEGPVASSQDPATNLPIYSLFGATERPTDQMLSGLDAIVFDLQDAGVRFYTYITTMAYALEECARHKIPFFVLDRPNPLGGQVLEGPMLDPDRLSFVGYFPLPVRYGMTLGELAQMFNAENKIGADLHVIPLRGWDRAETYEATGLSWVAPSPNLRTLNALALYPGIEILQAAGVSVGRGTDTPFELFGAPWINAADLAAKLNASFLPGVRFVPTRFTPRAGIYQNQLCSGVFIVITNRESVAPMLMGLQIAAILQQLYPQKFDVSKTIELLGSAETVARLQAGMAPARIIDGWTDQLAQFSEKRSGYLIYH